MQRPTAKHWVELEDSCEREGLWTQRVIGTQRLNHPAGSMLRLDLGPRTYVENIQLGLQVGPEQLEQ